MNNKVIVIMDTISTHECTQILDVWESSVRSTHDFLTEENIQSIKPVVKSGLLQMQKVICMKDDENNIQAFMGISDYKIEMLFINDEFRGKGIGKKLIEYAINKLNVKYVDVNEQNKQAVGFYVYLGFKEYSRSKTDSQGNPFPILNMKLRYSTLTGVMNSKIRL
ncbi:GNAT family N-acetyltransferase [Anaerophilus nitritogenes]|uniref:GNAT family N-acetyltransferase n=1 Tax=Anaerophilus nitritogenes TaxID=2498136 RepID=UPI00101D4FD2|nr:GNAT family N-acetyltransferase [Anaerophilus nitritogenes]